MEFVSYITENALILVPALYILGMIIKNTEEIPDRFIPLILLIIGIAGAISLMGLNVESVIQGILVTGSAVYTNQLFKQMSKKE